MKQSLLIRFGMRGLAFLLLLMLIQPVFAAAKPYINVVANWTPSQTLDTSGADERFVELQLQVQGNVQFWAAEISCTVGRGTELDFISLQAPSNVWDTNGAEMTLVPLPDTTNNNIFTYDDTTDIFNDDGRGTLSFTLTRLGVTTAPLGVNGADYSLNLANIRFKVKELTSNTSVAVNCRTMNFLDRDGSQTQRGRQTRTADLTIRTGYTLSGSASRQGSRDAANIAVTCTHDPAGTPTVFGPTPTDRNGNFTFDEDGGGELRKLGLYECEFESQTDGVTPDAPYLISQTAFYLDTPQLELLPVVLQTGDVAEDDQITFVGDVFGLAAVYDTTVANPFDTGDVNGDRRVDETDLSLTASNVGLTGPINGDHIIYGLGRDFSSDVVFPNSQLWWGFTGEGSTYPLIARSRTRDFWPQLSPDGSTIAYIAASDRRGVTSYDLYYLDVDRGRASAARMPRTFTDEALAPSWSPDGSMVAFICTPRGEIGDPDQIGYLYNNGDICIVNSNDSRGDTLYNLNVSTEIFPPAWLAYDNGDSSGYIIIYAGTDGKLHYVDLTTGVSGQANVNNEIAPTTDVYDMPIIVSDINSGSTPPITYLAYRFSASGSGDPYLQIGDIGYDPTTGFSGGVMDTTSNPNHYALEGTGTPDTTGVDYYEISPSMDILFYHEYNYAIANSLAPDQFHIHNLVSSSPFVWSGAVDYFIDSVVGNSFAALDGFGIWQPGSSTPTELHATRMTFDWVP